MKRIGLVVVAVLMVALAAPSVASAKPRSVLSSGMCGGDVFALQVRLYNRSYLPMGYHPGCYDYRTSQAVMAFQGWVGFTRTGVADSLTQRRLVLSVTPKPWSIAYRHVEVHKGKQIMILVTKNRTVYRTIHVSTAAPGHVTTSGNFHIYAKAKMSWSYLFHVWLPYANYVVGGIAIHGFASVPPYPASHGCIRVPMPEAPGCTPGRRWARRSRSTRRSLQREISSRSCRACTPSRRPSRCGTDSPTSASTVRTSASMESTPGPPDEPAESAPGNETAASSMTSAAASEVSASTAPVTTFRWSTVSTYANIAAAISAAAATAVR